MSRTDKPLAWLRGEIKTPREALSLPHSRPMPQVGPRCHELRIADASVAWQIIYRTDPDAVLILDVFAKKTAQTPQAILEACQKRLEEYDHA